MTERELQKVHCQVVTSVGECSEILTIDGSVDDVIKILESTRTENKTKNNIHIHVASSGKKVATIDFVEELKSNLERGFKNG
ncbi:hypothetical protein ACP3VS_18355 [Lysinibacillus sp. VIII_CA]|uniref:hypothetical protein n=1 Tax=Lysinibacillus sp. VIII_CA TaxID=3417452 RepID=UPI003CFAC41D